MLVPVRWRLSAAVLLLPLVAGLAVALSALSKTPCVGAPYDAGGSSAQHANSYRLHCLTDLQDLWQYRQLGQHRLPYVHGRLEPGDGPPGVLVDGALEYPVLTGMFMWATSLPVRTDTGYLLVSFLALLPAGVFTGWALARLAGRRALIWAAAPALVFYGVYNWDLLPVALVTGAVLAQARGRSGLAGVLLGLGAATKIYPGFLLLPLLVERLVAGDRRGAVRAGTGAAVAWVAVNLPFLVANPAGWWATYLFQARRIGDISGNTIWFWGFPDWPEPLVDRLSTGLILAGWLAALLLGRRWGGPGRYPWLQVGAAMLAVFLALNKVYSPQYALWILPFLVLVRVRWGWWVALWAVDATLFLGLLSWYADTGDALARQATEIGVWGKSVLYLLLAVALLRAPAAGPEAGPAALPDPGADGEPDTQPGTEPGLRPGREADTEPGTGARPARDGESRPATGHNPRPNGGGHPRRTRAAATRG